MKNKLAFFGGKPIRVKRKLKSGKIFGKEEEKKVLKILKSGILSCFRGGPYVKEFEKKFAEFCGCKFGLATTSGTTALHTALAALNLKQGDEVIVPAFTFVSTASVIIQERLKPVFVDIDETFCIDSKDIERKITSKTKAIIPVHLFGNPADMPRIIEIAKKYSLFIIEDCAQAHGASIQGKRVGSFGDFGCFSFFQTKNMTCGEGGMVVTSNKNLYLKAKLKREHGSPEITGGSWYNYQELGYNYNMTEIQAAIGTLQLKRLEKFNKKRIKNANLYRRLLCKQPLTFIKDRPNTLNVYHNFPMLLPKCLSSKRDVFVKAVRAEGVWIDVCYPKPLYKTPLFIKLGIRGKCPFTEDVASRIVNAFTDPTIPKDYIHDTCRAIIKCLNYFY
jgi:dTDP-4-amino-4,6-dideoxygalactose transaminase